MDVELPGLILDESEDEIILVHTVEIDRVEWGGEDSIPFVLGYSSSVSPGSESSTGNDDATAWCTGLGSFGLGGEGTRGVRTEPVQSVEMDCNRELRSVMMAPAETDRFQMPAATRVSCLPAVTELSIQGRDAMAPAVPPTAVLHPSRPVPWW